MQYMKIYLASKSPRRKELLTMMEVDFDLLLVDTPEVIAPNESPEDYSRRVTKEKLDAAWDKLEKDGLPVYPVLSADTEVVMGERILGKPESYQDAFNMLKSYSGSSHRVITSVGIRYLEYYQLAMNTTVVSFAIMSDDEIHHYLQSGNYKDKSGAYGIQSYIGQFINGIDGCFYSVMGLPLNTVRMLLNEVRLISSIKQPG